MRINCIGQETKMTQMIYFGHIWIQWRLWICYVLFILVKNVGAHCEFNVDHKRQKSMMDLWSKIMYSKCVVEYERQL